MVGCSEGRGERWAAEDRARRGGAISTIHGIVITDRLDVPVLI